jgi:pyruvate ferredoxin oxidoreductase gamma subunit
MALRHIGRPLPNAALLGGFAAVSGILSIDSVAAAIREKFPQKVADANIAAAREAYAFVLEEMREAAVAQAD